MYIIVCYDISDHRRRARLHEELLGFGTPVQKSVFECQLTPKQLGIMQQRTRRYVRKASDTIRYYILCRRCRDQTVVKGTPLAAGPEEPQDYRVT